MKVRCKTFTPMEGLNAKYLTPGKVYEAHEFDDYAFLLWDDEGDELFVLWKGSIHGTFEKVED